MEKIKYQFIGNCLLIRQIGEPILSSLRMWTLIRANIPEVDVEHLKRSGKIHVFIKDSDPEMGRWHPLKIPGHGWENDESTNDIMKIINFLNYGKF